MKRWISKYANSVLTVLGTVFVMTNTAIVHRPETPAELLKK